MKDHTAARTASPGRRAASYWFVDGLPEILLGSALVIFAGLALLWDMVAPTWSGLDWVIAYAGLLLYFGMEWRALDCLKAHLTYPRTGYVQPPEEMDWKRETLTTLSLRPEPPVKENVTFFRLRVVWPIALVCALFMPNNNPLGHWLVPVVMPALAVTMYVLSRRSERPYPWWAALILALTGPLFLLTDIAAPLKRPLPLMLAGGWLFAMGVGTLVRYLQTNPYPTKAQGVQA